MLAAGWAVLHLLVGLLGAGVARRYATLRSLLDQPGARRSHAVPTPRGGGIAIAVPLLVAAGCLAWRWPSAAPVLAGFGAGLALVALVGWIDDHRPLSASLRLGVHAVASAVFALGLWWQTGDVLVGAVAFAAPVALVNAWNFVDGIDGLAATQAIVAVSVPAALAGAPGGALGLALAAATLGFLPWNFPRARLFLGDVGSGAIGFAIGALVAMAMGTGIATDPGMGNTIDRARGLLLSLFPLAAVLVDTGLTLARRVVARERWWEPHVSHAFQHAARRHGHAPVTLAYLAWTGAAAVLAWLLRDAGFTSLIISLLAWYAAGAIAWWVLQRPGVAGEPSAMENRE